MWPQYYGIFCHKYELKQLRIKETLIWFLIIQMWPQYYGIFCHKYELKQLRIKET